MKMDGDGKGQKGTSVGRKGKRGWVSKGGGDGMYNNEVARSAEQAFPGWNRAPEGKDAKLVVVGGSGCNSAERFCLHQLLEREGIDGVEVIAVNTDEKRLGKMVGTTKKILLGVKVTKGRGAAYPEVGEYVAEESKDTIKDVLEDAGIVLIMGNIGGGTGSGAIPVIADIAKENGALVICIVSKPFSFEGGERKKNADRCLSRLKAGGHTALVLENDYMLEKFPNLSIDEVFLLLDRVALKVIKNIVTCVNQSFMASLLAELESILKTANENEAETAAHAAKTVEIPVLVSGEAEDNYSTGDIKVGDSSGKESEGTPQVASDGQGAATVTMKVDLPDFDGDLENESATRETSMVQKNITGSEAGIPPRNPFDDDDDESNEPGAVP